MSFASAGALTVTEPWEVTHADRDCAVASEPWIAEELPVDFRTTLQPAGAGTIF
ncbi:hypothetical protein MTP03_09000 [Tsukamurella sp. PLM1]|nr:hypothetical protein MTP03_09000 [Tsukamurella sp. PLM1]